MLDDDSRGVVGTICHSIYPLQSSVTDAVNIST